MTARERVAAWIKIRQDANADKRTRDLTADQQSLDRAADLEEIYNEMLWVHEMPEPKKQRGRRINAESREQFAKWFDKTYGVKDSSGHLSHLHKAWEVLPIGWQVGDTYYGGVVTKDTLAASRRARCPDCGDERWVYIGGPDSVPCATCGVRLSPTNEVSP